MLNIKENLVYTLIILTLIQLNNGEFYDSNEKNREKCLTEQIIKRYKLNPDIYQTCESINTRESQYLHRQRRRTEPILRGKPKPRAEVLAAKFQLSSYNEQANSLVNLVNKIAKEYLSKCPPVIYYDEFVEKSDNLLLELLFKTFPVTYYHGEINNRYQVLNKHFQRRIDNNCRSYILFLSDPLMTRNIIGPQIDSRVVVVSRSTQWKLREFLSSEKSSNIVNLLAIGESLSADSNKERPYVLYTHKLYSDGLGSNTHVVLTSWIKGGLSRPHIDLFPKKFADGFSGHRFQVMSSNQPPYIFRKKSIDVGGGSQVHWDGVEYRLLNLIGQKLNFSIDIVDIPNMLNGKSAIDNLKYSIAQRVSDVAMAGMYITVDNLQSTDMSVGHSYDCASFITLASKALPKYRAIMGPFQWPVWVALICIYLGGVFPIVFTDRLTLSHLLGNWGEIENMFWYVFGMFTNSLTFSGRYSWSNTQKVSTRLLIGSYWIFTIIITACYTGSIIAFVTLPAFPDTVDSITDLLGLFFRVGTLDNGGWESWFQNSTHEATSRLLQKMEYVSTLEEGIGNVTQSFFWNYAFLGSRNQLEYLVQSNFSKDNFSKRSALHLSEECFASFHVGYMFPKNSVYKKTLNSLILLAQQAGLMNKMENEVKWFIQRSSTGKLLQASSSSPLRETLQEERQLTTADTEGMFLLMGIGYTVGAIALVSEIVGGITNKCRQIIKRSRKSISSNWSSRRNSSAENDDGKPKVLQTKEEKFAHAARKMARKQAAQKEAPTSHQADLVGFGRRQFNLTKSTLRELYGDYNKQQPDYVLRDGQIIVQESMDSDLSSDTETREFSAQTTESSDATKSSLINEKLNENLIKDDLDKFVDRYLNKEIDTVLTQFDQTLTEYTDGPDVKSLQGLPDIEEEMFGSFVQSKDIADSNEKYAILDNLQLFQNNQKSSDNKNENNIKSEKEDRK